MDAILDGLRDFPRVAAEGTPEERKAFVRASVPKILLHPHERHAVVRIRRFPLPAEANSGNSSFKLVAGVRYELEKNEFVPYPGDAVAVDELLWVVFDRGRPSLIPA